MGEYSFRYLVDEVFFQSSYFFKSEVASPLILDCGSNIGMSVMFFKKLYPNARIIAFEPDPFTFETLSTNISENHLRDVRAYQGALASCEGEIELFRDASPASASLLMSTIRQRHEGPAVKVRALRLSPFITSEIDLIKLDVEGAESAVLRELSDANKLHYIRRLHLEYHHHIDRTVDSLASLLRLMEENNFGYQIRSTPRIWPLEYDFQDVSIYFYRKSSSGHP